MQVESITECFKESILQYVWPAFRDYWSWKPIFGLFLSGRFRQVLLFTLQILEWNIGKWNYILYVLTFYQARLLAHSSAYLSVLVTNGYSILGKKFHYKSDCGIMQKQFIPEDQWSCETLTWHLGQAQSNIWLKIAQSFLRKASFNFQM